MKKFFVTLIAILLMCTACNNVPDNVIDEFSYQDISENISIQLENKGATENFSITDNLADIDASCRKMGLDENNELIKPEYPLSAEAGYEYGVIMIVKTKSSKNILYAMKTKQIWWDNKYMEVKDGDKYYPLLSSKTYDQIDNFNILNELSHVQTKAEVIEVLYQTEQTNFAPGDIATVFENYYIVDGRTPKLLDGSNSEEYQIQMRIDEWPWCPLETDETYLIFGKCILCGGKYTLLSEKVYAPGLGIYCLSDPDKQAGFVKGDEITQNGLAYIQEHYPDVYNTYLAQAQ